MSFFLGFVVGLGIGIAATILWVSFRDDEWTP
jgi:tetrahydromethanopterin S-methyltransferase subunit B